jgi:hypothetical protein
MKIIIKHKIDVLIIRHTPLQVLICHWPPPQFSIVQISLTTLFPHDSSHQDYYEVFTLKVLLGEEDTT